MQHHPLTRVKAVLERNSGLQVDEFTAGGQGLCLLDPARIHCSTAAAADRERAELFKYDPRSASETEKLCAAADAAIRNRLSRQANR